MKKYILLYCVFLLVGCNTIQKSTHEIPITCVNSEMYKRFIQFQKSDIRYFDYGNIMVDSNVIRSRARYSEVMMFTYCK